MKRITSQQKKFVSEYIKSLNAEDSAKFAGYKVRNLKSFAQKLLADIDIINEIRRQLSYQIKALRVEKGYVIQKLLQIAEFSLQEEDILDKEGNITGKRKLRDTSAGLKALENLAKYIGFNNSDTHVSTEPKIITIENLDKNKI